MYISVLRQKLKSHFDIDADGIDDEESLFDMGHLDSFALVDLIAIVESIKGSKIRAIDVNMENFDSISKISNYLTSKMAK